MIGWFFVKQSINKAVLSTVVYSHSQQLPIPFIRRKVCCILNMDAIQVIASVTLLTLLCNEREDCIIQEVLFHAFVPTARGAVGVLNEAGLLLIARSVGGSAWRSCTFYSSSNATARHVSNRTRSMNPESPLKTAESGLLSQLSMMILGPNHTLSSSILLRITWFWSEIDCSRKSVEWWGPFGLLRQWHVFRAQTWIHRWAPFAYLRYPEYLTSQAAWKQDIQRWWRWGHVCTLLVLANRRFQLSSRRWIKMTEKDFTSCMWSILNQMSM